MHFWLLAKLLNCLICTCKIRSGVTFVDLCFILGANVQFAIWFLAPLKMYANVVGFGQPTSDTIKKELDLMLTSV